MPGKKHIDLPRDVIEIIRVLNAYGYKAYAVGGCVRDIIMGKKPEDWDISTDATPDAVKNLFEDTLDTGIQHGTVTVILDGKGYEVTTFRMDGEYEDNRHPVNVEFSSSIMIDLSRRDFTMNSVAYHPDTGFIYPFEGIKDIEKNLIKAVGKAKDRFREDALRMLRAVRFSAQLDFDIDEMTMNGIRENSHLIKNISRERIRDELTKILLSDNPVKFERIRDLGLMTYILPEFEKCFTTIGENPYHIYNVAIHSIISVSNIEKDPVLRWAMLLHDIGKPLSKTRDNNGLVNFYGHAGKSRELSFSILRRLRFSNKFIEKTVRLIEHHDRQIEPSSKAVRKAVSVVGDDIFPELLKVREADLKAQNPLYMDKRLEILNMISEIYHEIKNKMQCTSIKDLAVDGNDLKKTGIYQGREIGEALQRLLEVVLEDPEMNTKEKLLKLIKKWNI